MSNPVAINSESGLVHVNLSSMAVDENVLSIKELAFNGYLNLRGSLMNEAFTKAAEQTIGAALPSEPNTFVDTGTISCLWLGPDEWLLITEQDQQTELRQALLLALGDTHAAVTDITGTNTMLEISGSATRDLLAKGTPMDLHSSVFGVGQCAQTSWIKTSVTLYQTSDVPSFRIIVRRSFADYFGEWLIDAAQEFS